MTVKNQPISGLSENEVTQSRAANGKNSLEHQEKNHFLHSLLEMVRTDVSFVGSRCEYLLYHWRLW